MAIDEDNEVRIIDFFVGSLDMEKLGFSITHGEYRNLWGGRPVYHTKDLIKLFLYGYLNSIRSSRKLEEKPKLLR